MTINQLLNTPCAEANGTLPSRQQQWPRVNDFQAVAGVQAQERPVASYKQDPSHYYIYGWTRIFLILFLLFYYFQIYQNVQASVAH